MVLRLKPTASDFCREVVARASRETTEYVGQPKHFLRRAVYVSLVSVLMYLAVFGWEQAGQAAAGALIAAIIGNFAVVALVLLWQGLRALYLVHRDDRQALSEAREKITDLEAKVNRNDSNQALADALGRLDEWAVHNLWARHPQSSSDPTFVTWCQKIARWKARIVRLVKKHNCPYLDVRSLRVLGNLASEPRYSLDLALDQQMRMLSIRHKRIDSLISKYRTD